MEYSYWQPEMDMKVSSKAVKIACHHCTCLCFGVLQEKIQQSEIGHPPELSLPPLFLDCSPSLPSEVVCGSQPATLLYLDAYCPRRGRGFFSPSGSLEVILETSTYSSISHPINSVCCNLDPYQNNRRKVLQCTIRMHPLEVSS